MLEEAAKKADLTLILKGELIEPKTLSNIHPCVLWNFDSWYYDSQQLIEQAKVVDLFLTPSGGLVKWYQEREVKAVYLPEGCDPDLHHEVELTDVEKGIYGSDVSFVGTVGAEIKDRADWLRQIGIKFNLKVWGSFPHELVARWHTGERAEGDEGHNKVVSASKIMLDKTRTPEIWGAISARVYRTLAAKGFLLMRHIEGLETQFTPGKDIETFKDTEECIDKIAQYLKDELHRKEIAASGYHRAITENTWRQRLEQIFKLIR